MESLLYAEVYLICMIVVGLLLFWTFRDGVSSVFERWLKLIFLGFLINFVSNFCFTLVNGVFMLSGGGYALSYLFKTLYHVSLIMAVFAWCGYAETEHGVDLFRSRKYYPLAAVLVMIPVAMVLINLRTHWLFYIDGAGKYKREWMFHAEMIYLLAATVSCGVRLLLKARHESDPNKRGHLRLTASFPLCILAAWIMSFIGESVPVICVSIMIELLCLYMGTTKQQISMDKLTQVNNRQNLIGFMEYKLKNHDEDLYLLMLDVNDFKSINDSYGHLAGDDVLVLVASTLKKVCGSYRKRPYIARYGGDEFIIVMEAVRSEVESLVSDIEGVLRRCSAGTAGYKVEVSIGVSQWSEGMSCKELIAAADGELYKVKREKKAKTASI